MRLHNYTLKYFTLALLVIIALWAFTFYAFILDEVHDNIDDGLKNSKIEIIRESYKDPEILKIREFGVHHFRIIPLPPGEYSTKSDITTISEFMEYDNEEQPVRLLKTVFYGPNDLPYKLEIKTSMIEEDDLLADLSIALLFLYILLVLSIFILNYILLKKIWRSFYELLTKLKNYTLGKKESFLSSSTKIKEFHDLEVEVDRMMVRNENAYAQQKLFISNAAHELRTPLAISINKLELLAEDVNTTEEQMEQIGSIHDSLTRLVRLNKSLLMLTKIENNQFDEKEMLSFNEIIKKNIEEFKELLQYENISLKIEEDGDFSIEMDKGLAITLINNLIKNAITHNYNTGNIEIKITTNCFLIRNTSELSALDSEQIFHRFYRTTSNPQSTGLGLALVKTIIDIYSELSIEYLFDGWQNFKILKK